MLTEQKQKIMQTVRNELKLALGVLLKCAAALLILEGLVLVVTTVGLRLDGGYFPLGAAPAPQPPAFEHTLSATSPAVPASR